MSTKRIVKWVILLFLIGVTFGVSLTTWAQAGVTSESMTYTFTTPAHAIETGATGYSTVNLEGFYPYALPGDPLLPANLTNIALPPLVPLESVSIEVIAVEQTELPGSYNITPAGPALAAPEGSQPIEDWGPNEDTIVDGKNTAVYGRDRYFPPVPVELVSVSQMRKWRYVTLRYLPVSYNPVTGGLRLTTQATVAIRYQPGVYDSLALVELNDTAMDEEAAAILANYADVESAYAPRTEAPASVPGYAIITTNQIASASSQLTNFINHKTALGFNVILVTETQYNGLAGQAPNERPDKIRKWLKDNYLTRNIKYVLLIGSPDPLNPKIVGDVAGDLPMKMTWPGGDSWYQYPTDHYFADLTGNWNKDGDAWYGDWGDYVTGGVDWAADVYVGRIPIYTSVSGWAATLDNILLKTKNYELSTDRSWRRSALLAMGFLGTDSDGARVGENMRNDYLLGAGFTTYRQYWHNPSTLCTSIYPSEGELGDASVPNRWKDHPYGIVAMFGHGSYHLISIGHNGCADWMNDLNMIDSANASWLDPSKPAMVFQMSCSTGEPDHPDNLGTALLARGAVATIAGSSATFGWGDEPPTPGSTNHGSFDYYYIRSIINDTPAGNALFAAKATPNSWPNALAYNLYGDPSVRLNVLTLSEVENNNSMGNANLMQVNDVMSGVMNNDGDVDFFKFYISQHATSILIDTDADSLGSDMDTRVWLYDAAGNEVGTDDDAEGYDSLLYRSLNPGWWYVKVQDYSGDGGNGYYYNLIVSAPLLISAHAQNLGTGNVAGISFRSEDILAWSGLNNKQEKWVMFFDASDVGWTKPLVNLSRGWIGPTNAASLSVGFSANQNVVDYQGYTQTVKPWDWIVFNLNEIGPDSYTNYIEYHSGSDHGLTTTAEKVDALSIEDYWNYPQHRIDLYFSTTGAASVPKAGGGVLKLADEDLFQSRVPCSSCWWENRAFFDGSRVAGLGVEDVIAASYYEPYNDMYLTIAGTGKIAGQSVSQKDIFKIDLPGHTWGGIVWHGPDHGWNYNIDAFDYPGGW